MDDVTAKADLIVRAMSGAAPVDETEEGCALQRVNLMNALSETCLEIDDATVEDECMLLGEESRAVAAEVKLLLERSAKAYRQRHLLAAAREYRRVSAAMQARWVDLPETAAERRTLLASVLAGHPRMEHAFLTLQHRDFTSLTDQDVESCLLQLAELGVLQTDEPCGKDEDEAGDEQGP